MSIDKSNYIPHYITLVLKPVLTINTVLNAMLSPVQDYSYTDVYV